MLFAVQLVAQQGGGEGKGAPDSPNITSFLFPFLLIGLMFYFLLVRPARRQEREQQAMRGAIKKNDEVLTAGGIIGTVVAIKKDKDEVTIESANTRLRVRKSSIAQVLSRSDSDKEEETDKDAKEDDEK